jgi:hypothetical protein
MSKKFIATTARSLAAAAAAFALFASLSSAPASAQAYGYGHDRQNVAGVVASFDRFDMTLHVGPGQDIFVHLHQGTIIDPTGTSLHRGMRVDVRGYRTRDGIEAERINFDGWARDPYRR